MDNFITKILKDIKVELMDEFDKNFERSAFFDKKWPARKTGDQENKKGTADSSRKLLIKTGKLRRSLKGNISGSSITFTSSEAYATAHNEGATGAGRWHHVTIPQRQFIGFNQTTDKIVRDVIDDNITKLMDDAMKQKK